ncbi:hypothetical protein [Acuticoccus mangrovi]|uniref:Uncharacterized protein n=1 Tax=Acuticoccus mangrovi TaxID=2796142 RepID=A0A934IRK8_9HYPH|nr:hypothetical protein [Acuticoccus mangrovi]MBJ3777353.1 hypothetical protein [Acuticoccus mangrovi]
MPSLRGLLSVAGALMSTAIITAGCQVQDERPQVEPVSAPRVTTTATTTTKPATTQQKRRVSSQKRAKSTTARVASSNY